MSRDLPPLLEDEIEAQALRPFFAVYIDLPDPVHAYTGVYPITFEDGNGDEQEWTGVGTLGVIDSIGESADGTAAGVKVTLLQAPAEFRDDIAEQATRNASMEIHFGALGADFREVVAVQLVQRLRLSTYDIIDAGDTINTEITGESRAIDQRRPPVKRFTAEYQKRKHPGDLFFDYVSQMPEVSILWADAEPKVSAGGGGISGFAQIVMRESSK